MWRWTSGRDTRRRSGRGGKSPAGPSPQGELLTLLPLLLDQECVRQHHQDAVAMEPRPQSTLVLVPPQQSLRLLVELLHGIAPVSILHHLLPPGLGSEVAPVVLPLVLLTQRRSLAEQPTRPPLSGR